MGRNRKNLGVRIRLVEFASTFRLLIEHLQYKCSRTEMSFNSLLIGYSAPIVEHIVDSFGKCFCRGGNPAAIAFKRASREIYVLSRLAHSQTPRFRNYAKGNRILKLDRGLL